MVDKVASTGPTGSTGPFSGGGSGGNETQRRGITGGEPPRQRLGGAVRRGTRQMKEYYLYDSDFRDLERTGAIAALLFAVASDCFGSAGNVLVGIEFADNIPAAKLAEWSAYRNVALSGYNLFLFWCAANSEWL
jgi:hypothetical protein